MDLHIAPSYREPRILGGIDSESKREEKATKNAGQEPDINAFKPNGKYLRSASHYCGISISDEQTAETGDVAKKTITYLHRLAQAMEQESGHDFARRSGVVFRNLMVKDKGSMIQPTRTVFDRVALDIVRAAARWIQNMARDSEAGSRIILQNFSGIAKPGQMLLVLGKRNSGCTTLLNAITNQTSRSETISGYLKYINESGGHESKRHAPIASLGPEIDRLFPLLTTYQTLCFAFWCTLSRRMSKSTREIVTALLQAFNMEHVQDAWVGNDITRGVSGGERKRIAIMETLATRSPIFCWDNSTCGLDATTALNFVTTLRVMSDQQGTTHIIALSQISQQIFDLADFVLLMEAGRMLYQGPPRAASVYFQELGFRPLEEQSTSEFLLSMTDNHLRAKCATGHLSCNLSAQDLEAIFMNSKSYQDLLDRIQQFENSAKPSKDTDDQISRSWKSYLFHYLEQVFNCIRLELFLRLGDRKSLYINLFLCIADGLLVASLFYGIPNSTAGVFSRGGACLFSLLFLIWIQLCEVDRAVRGREVLERHKRLGFYRPSALIFAQLFVDLITLHALVIPFGVIMYFLDEFDQKASKFFIFVSLVYLITICITTLFRMLAMVSTTADDAIKYAGIAHNIMLLFSGYVLSMPHLMKMAPWLGWLSYINPLTYGFEGIITNQFYRISIPCAEEHTYPNKSGEGLPYQNCSVKGVREVDLTIHGESFLYQAYQFSRSHIGRNVAVVIAFTACYILITITFAETCSLARQNSSGMVFSKRTRHSQADIECRQGSHSAEAGPLPLLQFQQLNAGVSEIDTTTTSFTWTDIGYTVPDGNANTRRILQRIDGYAKPGMLVAILGPSGAGKTSLLNILSGRQRGGKIITSGHISTVHSQDNTSITWDPAYVEQTDLVEATSTVREALEFSAVLRQARTTLKEHKLAWVARVSQTLGLTDVQDVLVGSLDPVLKKLTAIGIEIVARPSHLLLLDEPVSGFDAYAASSVIHYLRHLSAAGQAIVCTIHQPSTEMVRCFDIINVIDHAGRTIYYGPVPDAKQYLIRNGADISKAENIADILITIANDRTESSGNDWAERWRTSEENVLLKATIQRLRDQQRSTLVTPLPGPSRQFRASVVTQTKFLTRRILLQYWRDSSYCYNWLCVAVITAASNGFTFWQLGNTISDLQYRAFSVFLIILVPPMVVNLVKVRFWNILALWQHRELPSRTYGCVAFCSSCIVAEIPIATLSATLYYVCWYYSVGFPVRFSSAGYVFLMTLLNFWFTSSVAQMICAVFPTLPIISNILPFYFAVTGLINGVVRPWAQLPVFWRNWVYYINPTTWWIRGVMSVVLQDVKVTCSSNEFVRFDPLPNLNCGEYIKMASNHTLIGYLSNPESTTACAYCPYATGLEYVEALNGRHDDKWKSMRLYCLFIGINWCLFFLFTYTFKYKNWGHTFQTMFARTRSFTPPALFRREKKGSALDGSS